MTLDNAMHPLRWFGLGLNLVATLAAAGFSFWFGYRAGGALLGAIAAVNGAAICSLLLGELSDRLLARTRSA